MNKLHVTRHTPSLLGDRIRARVWCIGFSLHATRHTPSLRGDRIHTIRSRWGGDHWHMTLYRLAADYHPPIDNKSGRLFARHAPRASHVGRARQAAGFIKHPCELEAIMTYWNVAPLSRRTIALKPRKPRLPRSGSSFLSASQGRDTGKPRPSKYMVGCFLLIFLSSQVVQTCCLNAHFLEWRSRI